MNKITLKIVFGIFIIMISSILTLYFSTLLHYQLKYGGFSITQLTPAACLMGIASDDKHRMLFLASNGVVVLLAAAFMFCQIGRSYESALYKVTPKIMTPVRAGQNQHGSVRWLEKNMFHKAFARNVIHLGKDVEKKYLHPVFNSGGIVIGSKKTGRKEMLYYIAEDTHTLCIGATRSGKSRTVVLQSIGLQALAGESMIMSDPKGELFQYTYPFLQQSGYEVIAIDFKNPLKSHRYNFLQNVIDAFKANNLPKAIDCAWDTTTSLVGEPKGERIWNDGESSVIASSILSVVYDNMGKPQYQNLTNVYYFISEMCRMVGEEMPINKYLKSLDSQHPAKALLGISEVAPQKTKGSFFTAALTTLRLFTNPFIYSMTCASDFEHTETGSKKRAIFIILPDEKTTYYSLASLFISQHYETLVNAADARGGRLQNRVNVNLDEFGNFTVIPSFANKLTVGGGRGIRFNLFVQSLAQLSEKYGKEVSKTVKGNCQNWIYLQAEDNETLEELSNKLGNYTVASNSHSTSYTKNSNSSTSASSNLVARPLLTPDEIRLIDRPYSLVISRNNPAIMYAPDLSKSIFNKLYGLGDREHNRKLREERENQRPSREGANLKMELWGIWDKFNQNIVHYCNSFPQAIQVRKQKQYERRFLNERNDDDE
jgi:type IV secretion system protein VirD4